MNLEKYKYLIALSHFSKFGPARLKKILAYFNNYEKAFRANISEFRKAGMEELLASEFIAYRGQIDIENIIKKLKEQKIGVISIKDENYPELLKEIFNPPQILYYRGELFNNEKCLAVVGSRNYTAYGQQLIEDVVRKVAQTGVCIVSGLALGVDAHSHRVAIEENTRTIAVLGTGIDRESIYPSYNRYLAEKIIEKGGAVISEFPIGTPPLRHNFPQRNRIISGISMSTLVIEARGKSGALITAKDALEQNREVLATPGNIYSELSVGPNALIKQGAKPVLNYMDVLESLDLEEVSNYIRTERVVPDNVEEESILKHLSNEPVHIDLIVRLTGLDIRVINATLSTMEINGKIRNLGGMNYVIIK